MPLKNRKQRNEYNRNWYTKNKTDEAFMERQRDYKRNWEKLNKDKKRASSKRYYNKHKEKIKKYQKKWYEKNKEKRLEQTKEWKRKNPYKRKNQDLKKKYGITIDDYTDMAAKQLGCCAICGYCSLELQKSLCVDHNHKSGKVRGLLCLYCNTGLGMFKDNPKILKKAIDYLKKHK